MSIEIPVVVEMANTPLIPSMNVEPILHEVRHALDRLVKSGESTTIDLRAMPLAPGEDQQIREYLGKGEVEISVSALGPSILTETQYPGVWWVEHRNSTDAVTGLYIEITHIPSIVPSGNDDIQEALEQLTEKLAE